MNKYVLKINGMRCGMCEAHVENEIRKSINVKKVKNLYFVYYKKIINNRPR